jgi:hypothetical protein
MSHFQFITPWDFVLVPFGVSFLFALMGFVSLISYKLGRKGDIFLTRWWHLIPCWLPFILSFGWIYLSAEGVQEVAKVDEEYTFKVQWREGADGVKYPYAVDNRGRNIYAKGADDTKLIRKRVYRGHCYLIGWEWMEVDVVPKPLAQALWDAAQHWPESHDIDPDYEQRKVAYFKAVIDHYRSP